MSNLEKEVKVVLNKREYCKINDLLTWEKQYLQTNYYYGAENCLINGDIPTIRIRKKNQELFLQVKITIAKEGALHIKKEYEKQIEKVKAFISKEELMELTGENFENDVKMIGELETYRKVCRSSENIEVCLDRNRYLDIEDYELELEYSGDYPSNVIDLLKKNGIGFEKVAQGKFSRFMQKHKTNMKHVN